VVGGLLNKFPEGYTPNSAQVKLLKNIDQAFNDGYKFVVCNAPTGSGKSFISKTLANASNEPTQDFKDLITSYVAFKMDQSGVYSHEQECEDEQPAGTFALTITKALQDQYKSLFKGTTILKGKSNYISTIDSNIDVELESLIMPKNILEDHRRSHKCPYHNDRRDALTNTFAALNYNMFFSLPNHVKKRQYLICDEAAELEDQLVKEFSCNVSFEMLSKMDIVVRPFYSKNNTNVIKWITNLLIDLSDKIDELRDIITNTNSNNKRFIIETRKQLVGIRNLHTKLSLIIETWDESEYLFETSRDGINFMPLKVNNLSNRLFKYADKVILMSATIIDPSNFCKSLGIDKFKYVEAESSFNANNAPIFCNTKVKLNYHNLKRSLPKVVEQIKQICEYHKNDKGIIHTHNNTITSFLLKQLKDSRFLIREPGVRNEVILEQHLKNNDPTVMVSPSMSHGVDLKDNLARFQIIVKAPYLPTKDKRIDRLMNSDFNWYINKMLCSVIQSCGRGVRSKKDYCTTYILDGAIVESVVKNKHKLPKYFIDRFL
jgi:ATP-dependent DNA helicase DinG|tara:strand:- start:1682 stop:3319 length:1638 start_codon:yes stop_codon:yes gene_type:complete